MVPGAAAHAAITTSTATGVPPRTSRHRGARHISQPICLYNLDDRRRDRPHYRFCRPIYACSLFRARYPLRGNLLRDGIRDGTNDYFRDHFRFRGRVCFPSHPVLGPLSRVWAVPPGTVCSALLPRKGTSFGADDWRQRCYGRECNDKQQCDLDDSLVFGAND
ncbi:hypothetical protein VTJ04DRAFT_8036 [Mycothermus thermophilus]|uniref:uncharacterized protein n=1 Tax=Humicola insolens TaxID=85995 RepID=UPI003742001C